MKRKTGLFLLSSFLCLFLAAGAQTAFAAADIQPISFTDNPDPVPAQGTVTYTVVAQDNDPLNPAQNPFLELPVPVGFSFVSSSDTQCSYGGSTPSVGAAADKIRCDWTALPSSQHPIDFELLVSAVPGANLLTVTMGADSDANPANNSEIVHTQVVESADLELTSKAGTPNPVAAGGIVTYQFTVTNSGPFTADSLVLSDSLPVGLSFVADNADPAAGQDGDWACSASGQDVTCTTSSLAVGATSVFSFRVKVTRDTTGAITNAASVSSASPEPNPDNNTATHDLTVQEGTDMSIGKTVDTDPVIGGQPAQFTVTATNEGPMTAANVEVVDTLPTGYTSISVIDPAGWSCSVSGLQVTCLTTSVLAGVSTDIVITATPPVVSDVVTHQNLATVSTDTTDPIAANNNVTVDYNVSPNIADLSITKSKSPNPVAEGSNVTSTIVVTNGGPLDANPVEVVDVLSNFETYSGYSGTDWTCTHTGGDPGGTVTCNYTNLPLANGAQAPSLVIGTIATGDGDPGTLVDVLTNTACTGGSGSSTPPGAGDSLTANNCSNGSVNSTLETADLQVAKSTSDALITDVPLENSFSYTITVHNAGPDDALAVDLNDTIPQYVSAGTGGRPATTIGALTDQGSCMVTNAQVHCALGDIPFTGDTSSDVTITITVTRPMEDGLQTNTASAYSTLTGDPNRGNNVSNVNVDVEPITDIEVTDKSVTYSEQPGSILAGTVATYTIQVRNNGPSLAETVQLADVFTGEAFDYIDSSVAGGGSCTYDIPSRTLNCSLGDMNSSTTKSITVRIRPDHLAAVSAPWQIDNTATVSMATVDSNAANNEQSLILPVQLGEADLVIEKNESPDFIEPVRFVPGGGTPNYIVYELEVSNRGPSLATGVSFVDNVTSVTPSSGQQLTFIRDTGNSNGSSDGFTICSGVGNTFTVDGTLQNITCDLANDAGYPGGALASGTSYIRYLVFEVVDAPDVVSGDSYHNEATVSGNEEEPNPSNNGENENTTVRTIVDLGLVKSGPVAPVEVEESFNLTLLVTNYGPGASPETTVVDNLPSGMVLTGAPTPSDTVNDSCTGNAGSTSFTCDLGLMYMGDTATITVPVKLTTYPAGGTITNTASVSGLGPEPIPDPHANQDDHIVLVHQPAILGDRVWLDSDANGIQDVGESGISGVTVNLLDSGGTQVATTTTNGSGIYSFTINHAADYIVEFVKPVGYQPSPQDAGADDSADNDADGGSGRTGLISINYGDNNSTVDAGMYQLVSLGNRVWEDRDADGVQDPGELNIPAVTVNLLDSGLNSIAQTTTDASGLYLFTDLEPGDYSVRITPPAWVGYLPSPVQTVDPDNNVNTDSNIALSPLAGVFQSGVVTLGSGAEPTNDGDNDNNSNLSVDFGLVIPARVGNAVWLDENSNGIQDAGEPGIANVTVQLKDSSGADIATTVTDTQGNYLFKGLAPDEYFIVVDATTLPVGMSQTTVYPHSGADFSNQNQSVGHGYGVQLTSGGENLTADFGYNWSLTTDVTVGQNTGALGDRIWIDSDGDGVQDPGEVGVPGAEVTLYSAGVDGLFWTADDITVNTATTDAAGNYIFDNLVAGVYTVEVTDSSAAGYDILDIGNYSQTGDPDHFAADDSTAPAGTAGDNRSTLPILLGPGDTFVNGDFGYQPEAAVALYDIGDRVWLDADRDGNIDGNETGITGVTVGLQNGAGQFIATTITDAVGNYLFNDLPNGSYTVVVTDGDNVLGELNPTYDQDSNTTNPDEKSTLILAGADNLDQDFGYAPVNPGGGTGTIGDTIFLDRDGSGTPDPGEGMEGVRVILLDNNGDVVAVTYTNENGNYFFGGLAAGDYTVQVDTATLPADVSNSVDPDGTTDSTSTVTLAGGGVNLDQDFGYVADVPGTLGDFVWIDSNADGVYQADGLDGTAATDDDEVPISGVTIDLYRDMNGNSRIDANEPLIGTTVTDAGGGYLFSGLPAGNYAVKVSDRAGLLQGFWHSRGSNDTNNNSQEEYYPVSLGAGADVLTADFGYYVESGSTGDRVWKDEDVDGTYNAVNDTPIAGVTVYLDIEYPDGTTVTAQTVTGADGLYLFANLLLDEHYNGIGTTYGNGGDEPLHTVRLDNASIPVDLTTIYATRGSNTDTTTVGGAASDEDHQDMGSDDPAAEVAYPPMGSMDSTNDFGYFIPGSIGDTIWNDMNNDGLIDAGEALASVTVTLTPPADVDLGNGLGIAVTTITNGAGHYLFEDLPPGSYTAAVDETTLPLVLQGHNTVDPNGGNDSTSTLTLTVAEDNLDQDFAYFVPSSIGNYVWDDTNGNGIQDGGESGHQGISVHLLDGSGNPVDDPLLPGTPYVLPTGAAGDYLFENLIPGTYQVHFVLPTNNSFTAQDSGADDALDSDPNPVTGRVTVLLGTNETNLTVDAGLTGAAINIEKSTNTVDADTPPGVSLNVGDAIAWSYVVTNTGNVDLTSVAVSDDRIGAISCPQNILTVGESMTCSATGTAVAGQYANTGAVVGTPPAGPAVNDSDPSHYLAVSPAPAIDIEKSTNGQDADTGTGPVISVGDLVTWTYLVTNNGNVDLTNIIVTDDRIGAISCPQTSLAVGVSMTCTATATAVVGQYENTGSVIGTPASGPNVTDSDPSHYVGSTTGTSFADIALEKSTNGQDADLGLGPYVEIGHTVSWSYVVTNTGAVDLSNVTVSDDQVVDSDIHCPNDGNTDNRITLLPVGATATCTATGTAIAGQYENHGSVTGTPPTGPDVADTDPSHYYGSAGSIDIEKYTNGRDADTELGPRIKVDRDVIWTYVVTNTGVFSLANVVVTDDQGVMVNCPKNSLAAGESMTCTGTGVAKEGQYQNIGSVTATTPENETVQDADPSHYFGTTFSWSLVNHLVAPRCPPVPDYCYMVADRDNVASINSPLFKYTFKTDNLELLNTLGVDDVEAITLSLDGLTLYSVDHGVFGIIDPTPGLTDSFTRTSPDRLGTGNGSLGIIDLDDVDGLSFDPTSGILYGSVRHGEGKEGGLDLLIQINPDTGTIIKNSFGTGVDYIVLDTAAAGANDVDDIAIDSDGTMFGVAGNSSGGGGDQVVIIDKMTGAVSKHNPLNHQGNPIQDMEGATLYNTRVLYGTTGVEFAEQGTDNTLYKIDKRTGQCEIITRLDKNFNGYVPSDFEAISCFPICK